jgi:hypothetical protein
MTTVPGTRADEAGAIQQQGTATSPHRFGAPTAAVGWFLVAMAVAGPIAWVLVPTYIRRRSEQPPDFEAASKVTAAYR